MRIDHIDGLRDPVGYLGRLREVAPSAWIVVEKVLEHGERLRSSWPVAGSTGYDFLNIVNGLFVDPSGEQMLTEISQQFTGQTVDYVRLMYEKKLLVLTEVLGADINRLVLLLARVCQRHCLDYTNAELAEVLRQVVACFPVYRTYVRASCGAVADEDVHYVNRAIEAARSSRPELDDGLFDLPGDLLLLRLEGELESDFAMRFQQLTRPAMAKGVEDTAFYRFNRLVSLNEVGGDPGRFGVSLKEFPRRVLTRKHIGR